MSRHWSILLAAPHRGMFAIGMIQGLLAMAAWAVELGARHGAPWPAAAWPVPASWLHALVLIYGVFGCFVFGFILTAGPRWLGQPDTPARVFRPAVLLLGAGWLATDLGFVWPMLLAPGLLLAVGGWLVATTFLWLLVARAAGDRMHIMLMAVALSLGAMGLAAVVGLAAGGPGWLGPLAIHVGLWAYLLPAFVVVVHRMLPFFSSSVIPGFRALRPRWALLTILFGSCGHGVLYSLDLPDWSWLVDLPAAVAAVRLTVLWQLRASFAARLLSVVHVAFAWTGMAFALFAVHSVLLASGLAGLGLAPVHALTLGFFSSTLIGMASRVTLGHSGLPIVGDSTMWRCFWAMQGATLLRMAGEFFAWLNPVASLIWLAAFALWAWNYGPNYWRPRADGQPG